MTRIQMRRDTSANWTANNPIPAAGEPCYETDTGKFKIGNGQQPYNDLAYKGEGGSVDVATPLKKEGNTVSLNIDSQLLQVNDTGALTVNLNEIGNDLTGKANTDLSNLTEAGKQVIKDNASGGTAPANMVTTDTTQTITGQKEFKNVSILFLGDDFIRGQQSEAYRNGAGLSMGGNNVSVDGGAFAPQWKTYNTTGGVDRTETIITTYNQSTLRAENFNTANKLVRLDGSGKLPAIDGSQLTNLPTGSSGFPSSKTLSEPDFNKVITEGLYYWSSYTTPKHHPNGNAGGYLMVMSLPGGNKVKQVFFEAEGNNPSEANTYNNMYMRVCISNASIGYSWSNWVQIATGDTSKMVTTNTDQTITGNKTFNGVTTINGSPIITEANIPTGNLKYWTGTEAGYTAITTKDADTLYRTTDTNKVYLGTIQIGGNA